MRALPPGATRPPDATRDTSRLAATAPCRRPRGFTTSPAVHCRSRAATPTCPREPDPNLVLRPSFGRAGAGEEPSEELIFQSIKSICNRRNRSLSNAPPPAAAPPPASSCVRALSAYEEPDCVTGAPLHPRGVRVGDPFDRAQSSPSDHTRPPLLTAACPRCTADSIAEFSAECLVISLLYIERVRSLTGLHLRMSNWQPVLLAAMIVAQKVTVVTAVTGNSPSWPR